MIGFSEIYAKVLRKAWEQNDEITSDQVASVLYFENRPIPETQSDRAKMIRNAIMTLTRMQSEGLIASVKAEKRKNVYKVKAKCQFRTEIIENIRELFGVDFI